MVCPYDHFEKKAGKVKFKILICNQRKSISGVQIYNPTKFGGPTEKIVEVIAFLPHL